MIDISKKIEIKYVERKVRPVHEIVWSNGVVAVAQVIVDTDLRHLLIDLNSCRVYGKNVSENSFAENV